MSETQSTDAPEGAEATQEAPKTFTQADVDHIVKERVQREKAKYADYDDLKTKAEGAKSTEERMADLEKQLATTQHEALRARVQAAHGISDEDAALFLTGADEASLTAQAARLAQRESDRKHNDNVSPREGTTIPAAQGSDEATFAKSLFGG